MTSPTFAKTRATFAGLTVLGLAFWLTVGTTSFAIAVSRAPGTHGKATTANEAPCGRAPTIPARYAHVIWIIFENQNFADIIGNPKLPYLNGLASGCGLATQFYAEGEPSLPNYIAMTSGSTQGIHDDGGPSSHTLTVNNIYRQVAAAGGQWRQYASKMPRNCYQSDWPSSSAAYYVVHHEAALYYKDIADECHRWMVPLGSPTAGALATDLRSDKLPAFAVISPADDGGRAAGGEVDPCCLDRFLRSWLPSVFASREYRQERTAIFLTWDENGVFDNSATPEHIPTVVIAPSIRPHTTSSTKFTHYSMLRTTEQLLGISTLLGRAARASSMRSAFGL